MTNIVGIDPGFGNTKVRTHVGLHVNQSVIVKPRQIGSVASGLRSSAKATEVIMGDGEQFYIGTQAISWGNPIASFDFTSLVTKERIALLWGTLAPVMPDEDVLSITIGLPVSLMTDETESKRIFSALKSLKGVHKFSVDGQQYQKEVEKIVILAQPIGAYYNWLLDFDGTLRENKEELVAVADIGQNTIDVIGIRNGVVEPRYAGGAKQGARVVIARSFPNEEPEYVVSQLIAGKLKLNPQNQVTWSSSTLDIIEGNLGTLSRFHKIILTGGGASLLGSPLVDIIESRGGSVFLPENPIAANVDGFYKYSVSKS